MSTYSVTERQSFKRCRRQWFYSSFNGMAIQSAVPSAALNTGTIWHKGMELWALDAMANEAEPGRPTQRLMDHMARAFQSTVAEFKDLSVEDSYSLADQEQLLMAMASNYEGFYKTPLEDGYVMIQPEQTVVIPVPNSPHKLEGTLDGLIQNTRTGLAYILEHKTYGNRPNEESLQFGDQYVAYLWILKQLGFSCGGVAYDGAWKRPAPPKGKVFDDLFLRFVITRNAAELDEFEAFLPAELAEMEEAKQDPSKRYFNRRWEGCWDCGAYKSLCQATSRGELIQVSQDQDETEWMPDGFTRREKKEREEVWPTSS